MPPTPFAILLVKFNSSPVEPHPRTMYENLFTAKGANKGQQNLVDYLYDQSHRNVLFGGSQVYGWFTMPKSHLDYKGSGINPQGRLDLITWAKDAAIAGGVNLTPHTAGGYYHGVVVCTNGQVDMFGTPGAAVLGPGFMDMTIVAHEVGHALGLSHSLMLGSQAEYVDRWDVMSAWNGVYSTPHPKWEIIGPGINAANMYGRGWLDMSRVWEATTQLVPSQPKVWEITLRPLHRPDLPGFLAARIGNRFFEFRTKEGWDAGIPSATVLVHEFAYNQSYIVPNDGGTYDMPTGSTISWNAGMKLQVTVTAISSLQRTARLRLSAVPLPKAPLRSTIYISAGVRAGAGGWVVVGGRKIKVPPKSPLHPVLEHVMLHELSELSPDPQVRGAGEREALEAISRHVSSVLAKMDEPKVPAPREMPLRPVTRAVKRKRKTTARPTRRASKRKR